MKDYQYEMTQCIFTSDRISYLRLNTENRENNLALMNHQDMTEIFDRFLMKYGKAVMENVCQNLQRLSIFLTI